MANEDVLTIENGVVEECDENAVDVVIPAGVTEIGQEAFSDCSSLTSVVIPESVTEIGYWAFYGCSSLSSVEFGGTVAQWEVVKGKLNLLGYVPAKTVKCSDGEWQKPVVFVEDGVLAKCLDESATSVTIPEGVTEIGNSAFRGCKSLSSVVIGEGVTKIGWGAFDGCESLSSVEFGGTTAQWETVKGKLELLEYVPAKTVKCSDGEWQEPVVLVEDGVLVKCFDNSATSITIPEGVTEIGRESFSGCESLSSVVIPEGVTEIGYEAFAVCKSLTSVVIPASVKKIGNSAFLECTSLKSVVIGEGVTEIGDGAFHNCESLTSVVIPEGVTEIGEVAFGYCKSLESVVIPEGVTEIGMGAFEGCESLSSLEFGGTRAQWEAIDRDYDWQIGVLAETVKCTDGEVKI